MHCGVGKMLVGIMNPCDNLFVLNCFLLKFLRVDNLFDHRSYFDFTELSTHSNVVIT